MLGLRFRLRGSLTGRMDYETARDLTSARLTLEAWAIEHRPHSGWIVDVESENCVLLRRLFWHPDHRRWERM